jgi:hypothetical protein
VEHDEYGFVIDDSGPWGGQGASLSCIAAPIDFPNHVHCAYFDPAAGGGIDPASEDHRYGEGTAEAHRNPRMTSYYATSRFDLRVFIGWR